MANKKDQIASRVTVEELTGFYELADKNLHWAKALIDDQVLLYTPYSEDIFSEYTKLYTNAKAFKNYVEGIIEKTKLDENDLVPLQVIQVANITKCVMSLLDSRSSLSQYGISLETQ